uniref:Si:ch211-15p9.2 n=1 Tax=Cyprinus carpio TaxID=7962 RepID=A0A8C2H606_CYPCA
MNQYNAALKVSFSVLGNISIQYIWRKSAAFNERHIWFIYIFPEVVMGNLNHFHESVLLKSQFQRTDSVVVSLQYLNVANMGYSRAVFGVQGNDGRWSALTITNNHNANNPDETSVLSEHSSSEQKTVVRHGRLFVLLIPFRAFGDIKFKWSSELFNCIYDTPDPGMTYHKLQPQDKFLILATNGLWELMHRQTIHRLLQERKGRALSALEDENSATHLICHALGSDGCSIEPKRIAKMLSLPQDLARMFRDANYNHSL